MKWQLMAVKWEDVTAIPRFSRDTDFDSKRLYKLSVGFLVKETDEYIVIADDVDLSQSAEAPNNYGTLIPKGCIRERRTIWPTRAPCVPTKSGPGSRSLWEGVALPNGKTEPPRRGAGTGPPALQPDAQSPPAAPVRSRGGPGPKGAGAATKRRAGASLRRFFEGNPHVLASTRDIARRLGMDEGDVAQHLTALERRDVVRQLVAGVYVSAPGRKAAGSGRPCAEPGRPRPKGRRGRKRRKPGAAR